MITELLTSTVPGAASTLNPGYSIILLKSYVSEKTHHIKHNTLQCTSVTTEQQGVFNNILLY